MNTPTDNAWLDEIMNDINFKLKPVVIGGSKFADEIVITGKRKAKQAILTHIDTVCREAVVAELEQALRVGLPYAQIRIEELNPNKDTV